MDGFSRNWKKKMMKILVVAKEFLVLIDQNHFPSILRSFLVHSIIGLGFVAANSRNSIFISLNQGFIS